MRTRASIHLTVSVGSKDGREVNISAMTMILYSPLLKSNEIIQSRVEKKKKRQQLKESYGYFKIKNMIPF